jgi:hypothetical protein
MAMNEKALPPQLEDTLQHIVQQIDILAQTMTIIESRLTANEDRVIELMRRCDSQERAQSRNSSPRHGEQESDQDSE